MRTSKALAALDRSGTRCRSRERSSLVMTKDASRLSNHAPHSVAVLASSGRDRAPLALSVRQGQPTGKPGPGGLKGRGRLRKARRRKHRRPMAEERSEPRDWSRPRAFEVLQLVAARFSTNQPYHTHPVSIALFTLYHEVCDLFYDTLPPSRVRWRQRSLRVGPVAAATRWRRVPLGRSRRRSRRWPDGRARCGPAPSGPPRRARGPTRS